MLEVGGGLVALLSRLGFECTVADVNAEFADDLRRRGLAFRECDLLHDDLPERDSQDVVVLCEVIEHMPVPAHVVLEQIRAWIRPGGVLILTTPNLHRLRNVVRMALGLPVFGIFLIPERGRSFGHPIEYSRAHVRWQLERAGFEVASIEHRQLENAGATPTARIGRFLLAPLCRRPAAG
jgi:2-polyprenyl-3-methyl-5-hydroxy-6-metoxy-1,4-benzoquinol methylase